MGYGNGWRAMYRDMQELYIRGHIRACAVQVYHSQEHLYKFLQQRPTFDLNAILQWRSVDSIKGLSRRARPTRAISGRPPRTLYEDLTNRSSHSVFFRALMYASDLEAEPFKRYVAHQFS